MSTVVRTKPACRGKSVEMPTSPAIPLLKIKEKLEDMNVFTDGVVLAKEIILTRIAQSKTSRIPVSQFLQECRAIGNDLGYSTRHINAAMGKIQQILPAH